MQVVRVETQASIFLTNIVDNCLQGSLRSSGVEGEVKNRGILGEKNGRELDADSLGKNGKTLPR